MSAADTAFILISAALVMFMTPGLALFYAGLVRVKNVLGTVMHSFFMLGLATVIWVVVGYSLSFGTDMGGIIGGWIIFSSMAWARNATARWTTSRTWPS